MAKVAKIAMAEKIVDFILMFDLVWFGLFRLVLEVEGLEDCEERNVAL